MKSIDLLPGSACLHTRHAHHQATDIVGACSIAKPHVDADRGIVENPYGLEETSFGDAPRAIINGPATIEAAQIYDLFLALAKDAD